MMPHHLPSTRSARFQLGLSLAWVVCAPDCIGAAEGTARTSLEIRERVALNGPWDFFPDVGEATWETVRRDGVIKRGKIEVPGAWQAQGYGSPGGVIPSSVIGPDLTPAAYLRHNLTARCLYVRQVDVPQTWSKGRLFLCVRRAYRYADVTVNGKRIGQYEGFSSPFEFDITDAIRLGEKNEIVLAVDNRQREGRDTVGCANYFTNTGGIGGDVLLESRPIDRIENIFAIPRIADGQAWLRVALRTADAAWPAGMEIAVAVAPWDADGRPTSAVGQARVAVPATGKQEQEIELPVKFAPLRLWSPDDPFLYVATVRLMRDGKVVDELSSRFGMREIVADGHKLLLNGKPLYLSGYGDDATEPLTGMLPWDKQLYLQRLRMMRSFGFNFVRHHSHVPHDAYFEAADEVGMLVQPEASMAYDKFWPKAHGLFAKEWPHIVRAFRNHPSVWAWCTGNELGNSGGLPERDTNSQSVALSRPITNGPLQSVAVEDNGVYGPPGTFPTKSFKQSNYYRDVEAVVEGQSYRLLGQAATQRVFKDGPHELGLKFMSKRDGQLTRVRYLRVAEEQGSHIGRLWDVSGRELAHVAFTNESASGWQEAVLAEPVPLKANETYVASVNANTAYAATAPGGAAFSRQDALEIIERAYHQAKELDPTRLVHASDGGVPQKWTDVLSSGRGEQSGPKPYLLHEYGNYTCSLPDFALIPRLNGVIRPVTYERAQAFVAKHGLNGVYPRFYRSSLAMRADAQKYYLEAARLRGDNAGYSFWLGIDFPESPEGCWDEGFLNQLWEPKPGLTENLREQAGPTVLITSAGLDNRSFTSDQTKVVDVRVSHFGQQPLASARLVWQVREGERALDSGEFSELSCGLGQVAHLGDVKISANGSDVPRFLTLRCELRQADRVVASNSWEFFAYPGIASPAMPLPGVFSEAGPIPGAVDVKTDQPLPADIRLLVTRQLKRDRHGALVRAGKSAILLLGTGGFAERREGYFLNARGGAFGGIIEDHPVFASIPHQGRLHLGLYQLIAGGGVLDAESMPAALRDGAVVRGLGLTGWISTEKTLQRSVQFSEVTTDNGLHLILCSLDLLSNKPESRYVLAETIKHLLAGKPRRLAAPCAAAELEALLR